MTSIVQHIAVNLPGRMESHLVRRTIAVPRCALQELEPDDLEQTMCDAVQGDEREVLRRTDEEVFRLHVAFIRAHGAPKREYTTFTNGVVTSGREKVYVGKQVR